MLSVQFLQKQNVSLHHIESRSSLMDPETKEFLAVLERQKGCDTAVSDILEQMKECVKSLEVVKGNGDNAGED